MIKLKDLIAFLEAKGHLKEIYIPDGYREKWLSQEISDCFHDSKEVTKGSIFACIRGSKFDGHDYVESARQKGASAILAEKTVKVDVPCIVVSDVRSVLGEVASAVHDFPSEKLIMIAVTGTNGKTTTTYMTRTILEASGIKTGLIGTVIYDDGRNVSEASRTTPEASDVQRLLRNMINNGCKACVMEASSHGIAQGRLSGCRYDVAVFTNLTPEHLDYHGDMESYFKTKSTLFENFMKNGKGRFVINEDDEYGKILIDKHKDKTIAFTLREPRLVAKEHLKGVIKGMDLWGTSIEVKSSIEGYNGLFLNLPTIGEYNAANALGAVGTAAFLGVEPKLVRDALKEMRSVPGRLEKYIFENGPTAVIDYAHTPDALEKALSTLRKVCKGNLWVVFGLGGNRYQDNRPEMGKVASRLSDRIVITVDNPRNEDPRQIAMQIKEGADKIAGAQVDIILDRKEAVFYALDNAENDDIVLIAGKGPERNIIYADKVIPYNDGEAVEEWSVLRGRKKWN
ncbi:UDP-N-acetylmuramoylalanyl-D-glutamate--2,6-diaminopimelate ligase [Thermovirga lienii DSM 17291]|jgi:UDP-N-acetylmuramoyl-L-alanyl-D-glutamate--2,6-diaminopimelate ligase|uniref:UDP-N-acetylmuramoyl-L-alanyl-D-glutamate--2,6-diaminopimelate ligase n=1 Tax=Thermovirga lienii (strain ATCC BAA-1197 / DSM 17291 / Cas60314) TaxID=580340 RepID=G7VA06_THELD|nr:UDP-N-acetylmuramoyl-L-alanyl-D-glutamate--2,6-diaminopimelate ligase [Thermovirga lienii]AER66706.1 UDP-N-acetylmuramoylalanyl-D-glutamate--2,6-diaminopimelate ligase [Thermovirga lienii DSM 17291]